MGAARRVHFKIMGNLEAHFDFLTFEPAIGNSKVNGNPVFALVLDRVAEAFKAFCEFFFSHHIKTPSSAL